MAQLTGSAAQRIIDDAIPRIFPKHTGVRNVLEEITKGPKSFAELFEWYCRRSESDERGLRKDISNARKQLSDFYKGPKGFAEPWRLSVLDALRGGKYLPIVEENTPPENAGGFWAGHLGNDKPTRIITGRPYFLESKTSGLLIRHELFSIEPEALSKMLSEVNAELFGDMTPVQPFIAISELQGVLSIFSYFDWWRRTYKHHTPEMLRWSEGGGEDEDVNLIILGTPFDTPQICELDNLWEPPSRRSVYLSPGPSISKTMPNGYYRVWVHRRWTGSRCETLIDASTPEVTGAICDILTSDTEMAAIIRELWAGKPWNGFPREFKLQFRVRMSRDGKKAKRVRVQQYVDKEDHPPDSDPTLFFEDSNPEHIPKNGSKPLPLAEADWNF
jgi:hypothetical protein